MTTQRWETLEHAARDAYEAYGLHTQWKNYQGKAMPQWHELPAGIQQAWGAAVRCTLAKAYRIMADDMIEHIKLDVSRTYTELGLTGD